jgi:hypothetical protein
LQINGNTIPTAEQFKYFRSIVQENGSSGTEIEKRISETVSAISMLNFHGIEIQSMLLIYKSTVR